MWCCEHIRWHELDAHEGVATELPELIEKVVVATEEQLWVLALDVLESRVSDAGVPCSSTAPTISCLLCVAHAIHGRKRMHVLMTVSEILGGRSEEVYSEAQRKWHIETLQEASYSLHFLANLSELTSADEASACLEIMVRCAEFMPRIRARVAYQVTKALERRPELRSVLSDVAERLALADIRYAEW